MLIQTFSPFFSSVSFLAGFSLNGIVFGVETSTSEAPVDDSIENFPNFLDTLLSLPPLHLEDLKKLKLILLQELFFFFREDLDWIRSRESVSKVIRSEDFERAFFRKSS